MLPSSTDLTYFAEIAKTGNLSQAATRLGVSQPSLSLAMQRLEHCLGAPLLVRSRLGVKLTKAGEQLLADTLRLLEDWENLARSASSSMIEFRCFDL